ncbi:MAG TPA: class E sortase [Acidimicrobiales bacterium]|nr:class E sortase [Acidimicrobiales bacterium]
MRWRPVIAGVGRALMISGALLLLFVVYQLWGTGIAEDRHQGALRNQFRTSIAAAPVGPDESAPPPPDGAAIAIIKIPRLGVEKAVVEGVGVDDLQKGPGHYPQTPMPGQPGNVGIAGHRTTYGAPFFNLDQLEPGDPILTTTAQGRFRYEVIGTTVVTPSEVSVLDPTDDNRLTLTTCEPRFSASRRMIVTARLVGEAAAAPDPKQTPPRTKPVASLDDPSLSGDQSARLPALGWGLVFAAIWTVAWFLGRNRRLIARAGLYVAALAPMAVTLYLCFEQIARLLPSNV